VCLQAIVANAGHDGPAAAGTQVDRQHPVAPRRLAGIA
jgi:hypothetical protein